MKIGIIGAGQIGGTLTRRLTKLGHQVYVANSRRDFEAEGVRRALAQASKDRERQFRATDKSPATFAQPA